MNIFVIIWKFIGFRSIYKINSRGQQRSNFKWSTSFNKKMVCKKLHNII